LQTISFKRILTFSGVVEVLGSSLLQTVVLETFAGGSLNDRSIHFLDSLEGINGTESRDSFQAACQNGGYTHQGKMHSDEW